MSLSVAAPGFDLRGRGLCQQGGGKFTLIAREASEKKLRKPSFWGIKSIGPRPLGGGGVF